ncbi:hypothetical protein SteCoe_28602 [Stentor coeruleus]|uniref:Acyltransferase 3 domain-containing protein n=1 Tax=Stentor coeruleus TaxID=5963 RepID=A0A1R2B7Y0_9CILI|nr:hypothetical protein SteCoe_28602 [Stentor coeruleus]
MFSLFLHLLVVTISSQAMSIECQEEWTKIIQSIVDPPLSTNYSKMLQFSGGELNNLGNYDSCSQLDGAKYVLFRYSLMPLLAQALCGPKICTKSDYENFTIPSLSYSIPINSSIPYIEYYTSLTIQASNTSSSLSIYFPYEYQKDHYRSYGTWEIIMLIIVVFLSVLALGSSVFEILGSADTKSSLIGRILLCFSLINNTKKLLTSRGQEKLGKTDSLEVLNAVRVMSIGWVILGHTCIYSSTNQPVINYSNALDQIKDSKYILIYGGLYAVDTFFWLSGFLMTYLFIIEIEKTSKFSVFAFLMIYVHRFLRITPVYMFVLFFFWAFIKYFGNGPMWVDVEKYLNPDCNDYWYSNLIYMNNFIPDGKVNGCLGVSWYLANDMQFFWISPIILILYIKVNKYIGWLAVIIICLICIISTGSIAEYYNLKPALLSTANGVNYMYYYYVKPYTRVAPYALGMACGFIVYTMRRFKEKNEVYDKIAYFISKSQENKFVRYGTFLFGLCLINVMIFTQYDICKYPGKNYEYDHWSDEGNWIYLALQRFSYGLGLSIMFIPILLGYFSWIINFMGMYVWSVLARLTFVVYLIHLYIMTIAMLSKKTSDEFDLYNNIRDFVFYAVLSFICAIPIVLVVEMPAGNLEKMIFSRAPPKEKSDLLINKSKIGIEFR